MPPESALGANNHPFAEQGVPVRLRDNPGRAGVTTGRTRSVSEILLVQVDFGPNDKQFKRADLLERVDDEEDIVDQLLASRFGGPRDLRAVFTFEKIKGELTNVFYSMESSNTDFYPHQFKPVLKFIESPVGRLLIADEVGLGKTIEAIYVWKELQAREDARRLLIVCPSMLREKWRSDLRTKFNITAEIVKAGELLQTLDELSRRGGGEGFVRIVSLEAIRPPAQFEDAKTTNTAARLARFLDENTATDEFALFDLVVIDEAHYLRNPSTANNRAGRLLREAARHMLLLTATPIQIASDNLYQLIRLIDPDEFHDATLFSEVLAANAPIIRALRALWRQPPAIGEARTAIEAALESRYFTKDRVLARVAEQIDDVDADNSKRIEIVRMLEARSLLGQHMVRSRKREVLERKVERAAQTLQVDFADSEREVYWRVTRNIRARAANGDWATILALIIRQRQMASSLVAALEAWDQTGLLEEMAWEDMGGTLDLGDLDELGAYGGELLEEIDLEKLEAVDTKYQALREFLLGELQQASDEKFVIFAFFRPTLKYLARRLEADGIRACLIMGGMGDDKDEVLRAFRQPDGPSVLLSSEVGSEGIDLQFCRFVVNYDLPWNPMRVEQRIGRLDRLGQKAERISIINLSVQDTIEDRILLRLYDRIHLFRDSIGDLEEILGDTTEQLLLDLLRPDLSDDEREKRAEASGLALENRRAQQEELEREAVNLIGFSDYILDHIKESRSKGRWLGADEMVALVEDYFARKFPGTKMERHRTLPSATMLKLSDEARVSLGAFIADHKPPTPTRLHKRGSALCLFDPRQSEELAADAELIDPTHPLIRWIRNDYERDARQLHPVAAVRLSAAETLIAPGDYVFMVHRWSFKGLRSEHLLAYGVVNAESCAPLEPSLAEDLVVSASRAGKPFPNAANLLGDPARTERAVLASDDGLMGQFEERLADFEAENALRCEQQETSARRFAERRSAELEERLHRFRMQDNRRVIPATEGLLRRQKSLLDAKLERIARHRSVDPTLVPLAAGIIRVE